MALSQLGHQVSMDEFTEEPVSAQHYLCFSTKQTEGWCWELISVRSPLIYLLSFICETPTLKLAI